MRESRKRALPRLDLSLTTDDVVHENRCLLSFVTSTPYRFQGCGLETMVLVSGLGLGLGLGTSGLGLGLGLEHLVSTTALTVSLQREMQSFNRPRPSELVEFCLPYPSVRLGLVVREPLTTMNAGCRWTRWTIRRVFPQLRMLRVVCCLRSNLVGQPHSIRSSRSSKTVARKILSLMGIVYST
jgi:hypothetical protein